MEILCPRCSSGNVTVERRPDAKQPKVLVETGQIVCNECNHRFTPVAPKDKSSVDLQERIQVLQGEQRILQGRLTAVSLPKEMVAHAENLEREAERIYDAAQRIRKTLADDTANMDSLLDDLRRVELELMACHHCLVAKIKVTKGMLDSVVEQHIKKRKG